MGLDQRVTTVKKGAEACKDRAKSIYGRLTMTAELCGPNGNDKLPPETVLSKVQDTDNTLAQLHEILGHIEDYLFGGELAQPESMNVGGGQLANYRR